VSIDTTLPNIISFVHNAKNILKENDKLIVTLKGDPGHTATFDIGEFKMGLPMYDDGTRGDDKADDGMYFGTYIVKKNDSVKDARITGYLTSKNGNQSISRIFERVSINAIPPPSITGVNASDRPQDQGFWVIMTWSIVTQLNDFDHYNIYREPAPITSLLGLTPLVDDGTMNLNSAATERVEVNVPTNKTDYYFAVTVVDSAGNESPINTLKSGSTFGPIQAIDNIPPDPVTIVSAVDKPDDQGKTIIVSWTNPNHAEDFNHYAIYSSSEPITALKGLKPVLLATKRDVIDIPVTDGISDLHQIGVYVTISSNGANFYFAVTAVDKENNESELDNSGGSVAGPVKAKDDIPPKPVFLIDVVDAPDDDGGFVNVMWIPNEDEVIEHYNLYVSKQFIDNETIKNLHPVDSVSGISVEPVKNSKFISYRLKVQSEPIYVAITAVDFGANESSLDDSERSAFGPVQAVSNVVKANAETRISAGFDSNTYIQIPAGAFDNQETMDILWPDDATFQIIDEANNFLDKSYIDSQIDTNFADTVRIFKASSSKLRKAVTITLSYTDITEMTNTPDILSQNDERQFRIFRLNEASRVPRWELAAGQQKVDTIQNTVSTQVNSFGVFRIARLKLPDNLDKVIVYPNPFIPSQSINGHITFKNLTENATIQIYSVDGEKVKTINKISGGDEATWNALNDKDETVASGTYIFFIQNELDTFTGKIIILR
ncbi:MAG: Fibronectin type-III protein, partial [Candidatus Poribacteria bacterium]|nr:Fibronectin type-III protein [Candidatus Poribacteria bacterium]